MREMPDILQKIEDQKIMCVIRGNDEDTVMRSIEAIVEGGIHALEITFTIPNAVQVMQHAAQKFSDSIIMGAGTIINPTDAIAAIQGGAQFIASPIMHDTVIEMAQEMDVPVMSGAMTPTEIVDAYNLGSDIVKVFPADVLSAEFCQRMKSPFSHIPLVPTGGIALDNIESFLSVGVFGVGVGSCLLRPEWIENGKFDKVTDEAKRFVEIAARY